MASEYIIYCDESEDSGEFFSNFYGGLLVRSTDLQCCIEILEARKIEQNLLREVKWSKVTENYLGKYASLMDTFFDLIANDRIKIRIMFTHNVNVPIGLTREQKDQSYFLLYYQFLKHAFGLGYSGTPGEMIGLRIYPDKMPSNREKVSQFRAYLVSLNKSPQFRSANIIIRPDAIAEIDSNQHVLLQCLDVVLGAMNFRLNNMHKVKPEGARRRGRKTIAKDRLYKRINARIRGIYPNFNIGISTGTGDDIANRWRHPYRHWLFKPSESERDLAYAKP